MSMLTAASVQDVCQLRLGRPRCLAVGHLVDPVDRFLRQVEPVGPLWPTHQASVVITGDRGHPPDRVDRRPRTVWGQAFHQAEGSGDVDWMP